MHRRFLFLSVLLGALLASRPAGAQSADALTRQVPWMAAALSEFLSDTRSFVARLDVQLPMEPGEKPASLPFVVAMDQGQLRLDLRLADVSQNLVPTEFLAPLKQAGWDRIQLNYHPQAPTRVIIPAEKAYVEFPKAADGPGKMENDAMLKLGRMEKTLLSIEAVDGHPCRKYRLTSKDGEKVEEAYVWEATDLNTLPIKLSVKADNQLYVFHLRQVRMGRPDPRVFGIPAGYRKASSAEELFAGVALRSLGLGKSPLSVTE